MNYSNYNNPYNQFPYTNYNYQQPNTMNYQQPMQQPQTTYLPLTFVNGIEGAKAFIVGANQVVYLKDSDSNILFEKKADAQGKYSISAFELKQIELNNIGKEPKIEQNNYITFEDLKKYEMKFEKTIEDLQNQIKSLSGGSNE